MNRTVTSKKKAIDISQRHTSQKYQLKDFAIIQQLGRGAFAEVVLVEHKKDKKLYALKCVEKEFIQKQNKQHHVLIEKEILKHLRHSNIVRFYGSFQDEQMLYLLLEYCQKGDLTSLLNTQKKLSLDLILFFSVQIIAILDYLQMMGIAHRDIKPDNFLLTEDFTLKLTDFGSCQIYEQNQINKNLFFRANYIQDRAQQEQKGIDERKGLTTGQPTFVGTEYWAAPELIQNNESSYQSDIWAFGVIMFQMTTGQLPFYETSEFLTFQKIINGKLYIPEDVPDIFKEFILELLHKDPSKRLGCGPGKLQEIKDNELFRDIDFSKFIPEKGTLGKQRSKEKGANKPKIFINKKDHIMQVKKHISKSKADQKTVKFLIDDDESESIMGDKMREISQKHSLKSDKKTDHGLDFQSDLSLSIDKKSFRKSPKIGPTKNRERLTSAQTLEEQLNQINQASREEFDESPNKTELVEKKKKQGNSQKEYPVEHFPKGSLKDINFDQLQVIVEKPQEHEINTETTDKDEALEIENKRKESATPRHGFQKYRDKRVHKNSIRQSVRNSIAISVSEKEIKFAQKEQDDESRPGSVKMKKLVRVNSSPTRRFQRKMQNLKNSYNSQEDTISPFATTEFQNQLQKSLRRTGSIMSENKEKDSISQESASNSQQAKTSKSDRGAYSLQNNLNEMDLAQQCNSPEKAKALAKLDLVIKNQADKQKPKEVKGILKERYTNFVEESVRSSLPITDDLNQRIMQSSKSAEEHRTAKEIEQDARDSYIEMTQLGVGTQFKDSILQKGRIRVYKWFGLNFDIRVITLKEKGILQISEQKVHKREPKMLEEILLEDVREIKATGPFTFIIGLDQKVHEFESILTSANKWVSLLIHETKSRRAAIIEDFRFQSHNNTSESANSKSSQSPSDNDMSD